MGLLAASSASAEYRIAQCFDVMTQGFYRLPTVKTWDEVRDVHYLLRKSVQERDYRTFRAAFVEMLHLADYIVRTEGGVFERKLNTDKMSFDSEYIYFQKNWFFPPIKMFDIYQVYLGSLSGIDLFEYTRQSRIIVTDEYGDAMRSVPVDLRIQRQFRAGGPLTLVLNLKNETPLSLRMFLARFKKAQIRFRKGGKVFSVNLDAKKVEYSQGGDVFASGKYLFNLYEIIKEESSFYYMTLSSPKGQHTAAQNFSESPEDYAPAGVIPAKSLGRVTKIKE